MFRARVLARTLLYVFLVTSTFFRWLLSNYVEDYLFPYCTPSLIGITTDFFLHHRVPGINAELAEPGISRSCSLSQEGYANVANRDFGQDLRFLRDARESQKTPP